MPQVDAKSPMDGGGLYLRRVLDAIPLEIGILAADGTILEANRRAVERYGLRWAEVRGRPIADIYPWSSSPVLQAELRTALARAAEGQFIRFEVNVPTPTGPSVVADAWVTPITDEAGRVTQLVLSGEDITERRRAEEAVRETEERFQIAFKKAPFPTLLSSVPDGVIVEINEAFELVLGYSSLEATGKTSLELGLYAPEMRERLVAEYRARDGFHNYEVTVRTKSQAERVMLVNSNVVEIGGRQHILSALQDITERRQAEQLIAAGERRLRTIFDNEPECVKLLGPDCTLLDMNPAGLRMIEADSLAQVVCRSILDLIRPEYRNAFAHLTARVLKGESGTLEFEIQGFKGTRRWLETHAVPMRDQSGEARVLGITRDITERKLAAEHLRRTSDLLAAVAEGTTDALFVKDLDGRYLLCNPAAAHFVGRSPEEIIGHTDAEFFDAASARLIADQDRQVRESGQTETYEEELTAGETRTYLATKTPYRDTAGTIIGIMGISRDITDRKRLEKQFLQAQKMEAVGQLAGGVAHDFNNLLTIISGYSAILLEMLAPKDPMRESVKAISEAGERAAALTRQLLAFSRHSVLEPTVLDLNAIVDGTAKMLRRLIGEDVVLTTVLDPNLDRVKVDPGQLAQVLMNLAVNARDAMPKGGTLTIETRNVEQDDYSAATHVDRAPGRYVLLAVSDTGCGMAPEVKARIFEPFFTTKGVGKGTGLGLAMVFGVIKQSGGNIEVYSELGYGTTFKIYLPAVVERATSPTKRDSGTFRIGGTETILLVEDEDGVRGLALLVLQSRGYTVLAASDGKDAMRVIDKHRVPIDLLVTDVVMPGMDGRDLAEVLRPRFPQMKVLFSSGYTDDAVVRHGVLHEEVFFLQKPYTPLSLAKKVREVLDKMD